MGACTALGCTQHSSTQGKVGVYRCCSCVYFPASYPSNLWMASLLLCSACVLCHLVLTRAMQEEWSFWIHCFEWGYCAQNVCFKVGECLPCFLMLQWESSSEECLQAVIYQYFRRKWISKAKVLDNRVMSLSLYVGFFHHRDDRMIFSATTLRENQHKNMRAQKK